ncbi:MAG: filamentous hemagglutinin N-terminal domain-containing protein, partial [Gammaproteobacteria bacterium]|nr:filamentous hemagglutinin N-terminal domain-containing protein [Gammaproteobacteria bacterium]
MQLNAQSLAVALIVGLASGSSAEANPAGAEIANGQASFATPDAATLNITNSPGAILNWQQFSIAPPETTRFIQQSTTSAVLNRVTGQDPSAILGQLVSNGRVFLINPNGIVFGADARVDTAGLIASTLNITDASFRAGKLAFEGDTRSGAIKNSGYLKAGPKGEIVLIAPQIENAGVLDVHDGQLILAAGERVKLASLALNDVTLEVQAPTDRVLNLGKLIAEQGAIGVFAGQIKNSGEIVANSLGRDAQGRIVLSAQAEVTVDRDARVAADGPTGGDIRIQSTNGTTLVDGTVAARGTGTGAAEGTGGDIKILGVRVGLTGHAEIDASGAHGGGEVLVGGDWQGKNPAIQNAERTTVTAGASIKANAGAAGNGGKVVVWADESTGFHGSINAKGGAQSGNGGTVETSGKQALDIGGARIDAAASQGTAGTWLLDPSDITLIHGSANALIAGLFNPATTSSIGDTQINAALNSGTDVTIQTNGGNGGSGNIVVNGSGDIGGAVSILNSTGGTRSLSLLADGSIDIRSGANIGAIAGNVLSLNLTSNIAGSSTIAGSIDLQNGTLSVSGGGLALTGTVKNGRLVTSGGSFTPNFGVLDSITLGNSLAANGLLQVANSLTLADGITFNLQANQLRFITPVSRVDTLGAATLQIAGGILFQAAGGTTTIGNNVAVQGFGTLSNCCVGGTPSLTNNGLIEATVAGQTWLINPSAFTNNGTLRASGGTLTIQPGAWSNTGALVANGAAGILNLGSNSAGAINVIGTLDLNTGVADMGTNGTFGALGLSGLTGTIKSGRLNDTGGLALGTNFGVLDSITLGNSLAANGLLQVANSLTLADGITFNLQANQLRFITPVSRVDTLGAATLQIAGGILFQAAGGTTTIGNNVAVQGFGTLSNCCVGGTPSLTNNGLIEATVAGQTLLINPSAFTNNGTLRAS